MRRSTIIIWILTGLIHAGNASTSHAEDYRSYAHYLGSDEQSEDLYDMSYKSSYLTEEYEHGSAATYGEPSLLYNPQSSIFADKLFSYLPNIATKRRLYFMARVMEHAKGSARGERKKSLQSFNEFFKTFPAGYFNGRAEFQAFLVYLSTSHLLDDHPSACELKKRVLRNAKYSAEHFRQR